MKIAFIADIHGNYEALKAVLVEIEKLGVHSVYCAGDVVGYYSQVNEVCRVLRERKIPSVMGNHDWYLAGGGFCRRSRSVNDCLLYQRNVIEKEHLEWLRTLPLNMHIDNIHVVHGGWTDPLDEYVTPTEAYFEKVEGEIFVSGHTHVQRVEHFAQKVYCNPGSVGQPRDGDPRAAFAVFDGSRFTLHRVEYDMQVVFDRMEAAGFNDYYYGCLKTGSKNLRRLADSPSS